MKVMACMFLAGLESAWDPVRPRALVRKVGDIIVVNQWVRILLKLENVTYVRDSLQSIKQGLHTVTEKLLEKGVRNERLEKKVLLIQEKVRDLENNFLKTRNERNCNNSNNRRTCRFRSCQHWIECTFTSQSQHA